MSSLLKNLSGEKELLICGFAITDKEGLMKIKKLWAGERKEINGRKIIGRSKNDTLSVTSKDMGGAVVLFDPKDINNQILGEIKVRTPMGLYYSKKYKMLFTGSDHWIFGLSRGRIIKKLNNRYFNCLHGLAESIDRKLWVATTGIDAILKIDINTPQKLLSSWFATENGYNISANGNIRYVNRGIKHQGINDYSTPEHTTHINSILEYRKDKLLAIFFHQGELVEIDIKTGKVKTIMSGLREPHSIRKASFGYIVSDTNGKRVVKLNTNLKIIGEIQGDYDWIQDAIELKNKNIAIADANNGRIVIVNPMGRIEDEYIYGRNEKRIGVLLTIKVKDAINIFIK